MPAGTIALTNNSESVTGTGTSFNTELKVNDFIVAVVGGVPYTLGVKSIESNTALTLIQIYNGPSAAGLAWTPVPFGTMAAITAQLAAQVTYAIRGFNLDKANWQQVFTGTGNVTINLPDGTSWTGPAWGGIATSISNALTKSDNLGSVANKQTAWNNIAQYGSTSTTAARGDDARLNTVSGKTGGLITGSVTCDQPFNSTVSGNYGFVAATTAADATGQTARGMLIRGSSTQYDVQIHYRLVDLQYHCLRLIQNSTEIFRANSNGACYAVSFNPTSDSRLKFNKKFIGDALSKSMTLRGMTYQIQGEEKAGVIAQDAQKILPESVTVGGEEIVLEDGGMITDQLSLDYAGITALNTEALKDVVKLMLECLTDPDSARAKLINLVDAINASTDDANETDMRMEWALVNQPETQPEIEPPVTDSTDADS